MSSPQKEETLNSNVINEIGPRGDIVRIYTFCIVGIFILLIACINFMNLFTARFSKRTLEVGMRKTVGATQISIIKQFLCESIAFSFISLFFTIIIVICMLPQFNYVVERELSLNIFTDWIIIIGLFIIALVVGTISGSYPAFFIASFKPVDILKGSSHSGPKGSLIRKILVVFQFAISVILIIGTFIIQQQIHFMKNKYLGYDKEDIVIIEIKQPRREIVQKYNTYKKELMNHHAITHVAISRTLPSRNSFAHVLPNWEGSNVGESKYVHHNIVDFNFIDTYGIALTQGRNFFGENIKENPYSCIINETAAKSFGWLDPIGKRVGDDGRVIGVVKDFHFASLKEPIEPLILLLLRQPWQGCCLSIKIVPSDMSATLEFMRRKYKELFPDDTFEYKFYSEELDQVYDSEERTAKTIRYFAILSIFIACLGLLGLSMFMAEQKTKETGIRKVLGASLFNIIFLHLKEFSKWIILANIIAWPVIYELMNRWLQDFAYRIDIELWVFILSSLLTLFIALITVSYQSIKAALVNPVDSLKHE